MTQLIDGKFECLLFSPKGRVEGALIRVKNDIMQLTLDKEDRHSAHLFGDLSPGQPLSVEADAAPASTKGEAAHQVRVVKGVVAVNGKPADSAGPEKADDAFRGKVERLHFARHGEANGVVLDSGDFIHLKPKGFKVSRLKVGDKVEARGEARRLETGVGSVVDAVEINGKAIARDSKIKPKPKH